MVNLSTVRLEGRLNVTLHLREDIGLNNLDLERLENLVSWKDFSPDYLSGRHAIMNLSEGLCVPQNNRLLGFTKKPLVSLKVKGAHYKKPTKEIREQRFIGGEDPTNTNMPDESFLVNHTGFGSGRSKYHFDSEGRFTLTGGDFVSYPKPVGVCPLQQAIDEFNVTHQKFMAGLDVCYPLGYGSFDDLIYSPRFEDPISTGFVVLAISNKKDLRLADQIRMFADKDGNFFEELFFNMGRQYRAFQQKGFSSKHHHLEDVSVDESNPVRAYFNDQEDYLSIENLTQKQFFGYSASAIASLMSSVKRIDPLFSTIPQEDGEHTSDFNGFIHSTALAYSVMEEKKVSPLKEFLKGFFYDLDNTDYLAECSFNQTLLMNTRMYRQSSAYDVFNPRDATAYNDLHIVSNSYMGSRFLKCLEESGISYDQFLDNPKIRADFMIEHKEEIHYNRILNDHSSAVPFFIQLKEAFDRDMNHLEK
jgi:hypothetical protein